MQRELGRRAYLGALATTALGAADGVAGSGAGDAAGPSDDAAQAGGWSMAGSDPGGTGSVDASGPQAPLASRWTADGVRTHPVIVDGAAVVGTDGGLRALELDDGSERWRVGEDGFDAGWPATDGERIYAADDGVVAVEAATGSVVWRADVDAGEALVAADGAVYAADGATITRLDAGSGDSVWQSQFPAEVRSAPVVGGGYVCATAAGDVGRVAALDASTGSLAWQAEIDAEGYVALERPVAADGTLYVSDFNGRTIAYDVETGDEQWRTERDSNHAGPMSLAGGQLFLGGGRGAVLDADTGEAVRELPVARGASTPAPALADGVAYFLSTWDRIVYAVDAADGTTLGRYHLGERVVEEQPVVTDGVVFARTSETLHALEGVPDGREPSASVEVTVESGAAASIDHTDRGVRATIENGTTLRFDASGSTDPDGEALSHQWWGTGDSRTGESIQVTFDDLSDRPHVVELLGHVATDEDGLTDGRLLTVERADKGTATSTSTPVSTDSGAGASPGTTTADSTSAESRAATSGTARPSGESSGDAPSSGQVGTDGSETDLSQETSERSSAGANEQASDPSEPESAAGGVPLDREHLGALALAGTALGGLGLLRYGRGSSGSDDAGDSPSDRGGSGGSTESSDGGAAGATASADSDGTGAFPADVAAIETAEALSTKGPIRTFRGTLRDGPSDVRILALDPDCGDEAADAFASAVRRWDGISQNQHVASVLDRGGEPQPWVAFDPGARTLAELLGTDGADVDAGIDAVLDAAEAVRLAGLYSVTHGEITPSVVHLADGEGGTTATVSDWGLSRAVGEAVGDASATPYTAPERLRDGAAVGVRTDVYGLGAVAYHVLTGRPPFADADDLPAAIRAGEPRSPAAVADVPEPVADVVRTAMAPDPGDRYDSAYDFRGALSAALR